MILLLTKLIDGTALITAVRLKSLAHSAPELAAEWAQDLNQLTPAEVSRSHHGHHWWRAGCGHQWRATVNNRFSLGTGCPICAKRRVTAGVNDLLTLYPLVAEEWSPRNSESPQAYTGKSRAIVWWNCRRCRHQWRAPIQNRTIGKRTGCPLCAKSYSKLELIVAEALESRSIKFVANSRPLRTQSGMLELDFLLPQHSLALEIQDFATHSKASDIEALEGIYRGFAEASGAPLYKKGSAYHELKRRLAREQLGVTLVDIWEDQLLSSSFSGILDQLLRGE